MALFPSPQWTSAQRALLTTLALFVRARRDLPCEKEDASLLHHLSSPDFSWDEYVAFARRHRVVPMVFEVLKTRSTARISPAILHELRDESRRGLLHAEGSFQRLKSLSQSLKREGIVHAAYKGPALSLQAYGDVGLRTFGDLDLFVPRADLDRVVAWAKREQYTLPEWDGGLADRGWLLAHLHHVSAYRKSAFSDAHLELHWRALPPMSRPGAPTIDAWLEAPLDSVDGVPVLPWPRTFAANAEHHARHGWSRLMLLVDCAVRPLGPGEMTTAVDDALGARVVEATRDLAEALTNDALYTDAPALLQRTWLAEDPYQFEVGGSYLDALDSSGAWQRRRRRFQAAWAVVNRKEAIYAVARQAYLEANVAAGRVFGPRPNSESPMLKRFRELFR